MIVMNGYNYDSDKILYIEPEYFNRIFDANFGDTVKDVPVFNNFKELFMADFKRGFNLASTVINGVQYDFSFKYRSRLNNA